MLEDVRCECCGKSVSDRARQFCSPVCEDRLRELPSLAEIDRETRRFQDAWEAKDFRRRDTTPEPDRYWHVPVINSAWLPDIMAEES